jgi:hypothetical protein
MRSTTWTTARPAPPRPCLGPEQLGAPEQRHARKRPWILVSGPGQRRRRGGGFEPAALGKTWLDQPHHHGAWYYSCEIDLGFCGGLRAARTTLVDDDIFGRIALGGELEVVGEHLHVHPRDGVRRRFHARLEGARMDLEIHDGGRLSGEAPLVLGPGLDTWEAVIDHPPALPAPCACRWHRARRAPGTCRHPTARQPDTRRTSMRQAGSRSPSPPTAHRPDCAPTGPDGRASRTLQRQVKLEAFSMLPAPV